VRTFLETYAAHGVRFFTPDVAFVDAEKYLPELLAKRGKTSADLAASLRYLRQIIEPVEHDFYSLFESEARTRLRGRDEEDWPVLAAALGAWQPDLDGGRRFFRDGCRGLDNEPHRNFPPGKSQND
jgi:hypothetical protein